MRVTARRTSGVAVAMCCVALTGAVQAPPARAFNPIGTVCGIGGLVSGVVGKACNVGGKLLGVGKKVLGGASAVSPGTSKAQAVIGLAAIGAWVLVGAKVALHETAKVIAHTTTPRLATTWFSSTYWRMAAIGAMLTLPFLFAAAVQALVRSDLALLLRAAFGYLPMALIGVGIAAPMAMLLLAATDEMCAVLSSAAGNAGVHFLSHAGVIAGGLSLLTGSPFLALLTGLIAAFGALVLWIELLMREAAVYVVVLMLPIAFAALVWPARRVWAVRAVELLVALILSKFAMVAVLTLGGAALGQSPYGGMSSMLAGGVLVILGAFAPWAMIRLLPLAELASGAAGALRGETWRAGQALNAAGGIAEGSSQRLLASGGETEPVADVSAEAARAETARLSELPGVPGGDRSARSARGDEQAPDPAPAADKERGSAERIPGLGPEYQMEDFAWDLDFGPDAEWPPRVMPAAGGTPPDAAPDGPPASPPNAPEPPPALPPPAPEPPAPPNPGASAPPADDPNPLPPDPEPGDGPL